MDGKEGERVGGGDTPSTLPREGALDKGSIGSRRSRGSFGTATPLGIGWLEEALGVSGEGGGSGGSRSSTPMNNTRATSASSPVPTDEASFYEEMQKENERLRSLVEAIATSEKAKAALTKPSFHADVMPGSPSLQGGSRPSKQGAIVLGASANAKELLAWAPDKPAKLASKGLDSLKRNLSRDSPVSEGRGPSAEGPNEASPPPQGDGARCSSQGSDGDVVEGGGGTGVRSDGKLVGGSAVSRYMFSLVGRSHMFSLVGRSHSRCSYRAFPVHLLWNMSVH